MLPDYSVNHVPGLYRFGHCCGRREIALRNGQSTID